MTPKKYAFIDALRGIAFLGVLACHVSFKSKGLDERVLALLANCDKGVQLFFILSALTLFLSLDSRKDESSRPELNFFLRRFFRIAPLFYFGILFYGIVASSVRVGASATTLSGMIATLLFIHGWSPYWINHIVPGGWSIAVEMTFYLFVPRLYRALNSLKRSIVFAIVACGLAVGIHYVGEYALAQTSMAPIVRRSFLRWWLPNQLPAFALGFVLYHVLRRRTDQGDTSNFARAICGTVIAACAFVGLTLTGVDDMSLLEIPLFGAVLCLFAYSLALFPLRAFVNPLVCHLGKVSFSCYIVHFAVLRTVDRLLPSLGRPEIRFVALSGLALAGTAAAATLTYHLIEVPGQALGRRVITGLERQTNRTRAGVAYGTLSHGA